MAGESEASSGSGTGGVPLPEASNSAAQDPVLRYVRVMQAHDLSDRQKEWLITYASKRFRGRERIAHLALAAMLATLVVTLGGAIVDGVAGTAIVARLKEASTLLSVANGLFAAIIATYFGISSFRPSS